MAPVLHVESSPAAGEYLEVSADPTRCPCATFARRGQCEHVALAVDVLTYGCKRSKYLFKSALHKELRRGDLDAAAHWASWVDRAHGQPVALEYLRKIWSEETLNLDLAVRLHAPEISLAEALELFCRSSKVWEFPDVWDDLEVAWGPLAPGAAVPRARTLEARVRARDYRALIRQFNGTRGRDSKRAIFRERMMDALGAEGLLTGVERRVFEIRFASNWFEAEDYVLLLLAAAKMPEGANCYVAARPQAVLAQLTGGSHVRQPPGYVYDYHTIAGRERLDRWRVGNPGRHLRVGVDTGDVDLRWAGGMMTLFWRFEAFRQAGSTDAMDRLRWSDVVPTERWHRFCAWNDDWP